MGAAPIARLCAELGLVFHDMRLLQAAFTHSSYKNEHRGEHREDNERLEFLGDAVLELCVSRQLYTLYPSWPEGELTRRRATIVCEASLRTFAKQLRFDLYMRLGKGEELSGGRERASLLADVFEAFIGALFVDQGLTVVERFLSSHFYPRLGDLDFTPYTDYKTMLQERTQAIDVGEVIYETVEECGPAHARSFGVRVHIGGRIAGEGRGRSKKEAEQRAAQKALEGLSDALCGGEAPCS